jgi:hypothetical protein
VAEFVLSGQFLQELAEFEKSASQRDLKNLEETLANIIQNPRLSGRIPSFYDPSVPSYLFRSANILLHYRISGPQEVEFLNLFWSKI